MGTELFGSTTFMTTTLVAFVASHLKIFEIGTKKDNFFKI